MSNNFLCSLPNSLSHHGALEEIHLSGNLFTSFPNILDSIPNLKYHDLVHLLFLDSHLAEEQIQVKDELVWRRKKYFTLQFSSTCLRIIREFYPVTKMGDIFLAKEARAVSIKRMFIRKTNFDMMTRKHITGACK